MWWWRGARERQRDGGGWVGKLRTAPVERPNLVCTADATVPEHHRLRSAHGQHVDGMRSAHKSRAPPPAVPTHVSEPDEPIMTGPRSATGTGARKGRPTPFLSVNLFWLRRHTARPVLPLSTTAWDQVTRWGTVGVICLHVGCLVNLPGRLRTAGASTCRRRGRRPCSVYKVT